jgi:hypothetical protein
MNSSNKRLRIVAGIVLLVGVSYTRGAELSAPQQPTRVTDQRGRQLVAEWLATIGGSARGQIILVTDEAVARTFPSDLFYVLRFRQYPVVQLAPKPLKQNNILVVQPDAHVEHLPDAKRLENFFLSQLITTKDETQARDAVKAWLRLSQEFYQDGFFRFSIPDQTLTLSGDKDGIKVSGKAVVDPQGGNKGEIIASLIFDQAGKLANVLETGQVFPGARPICQATKLLDPDPIVRGMAEQAILVMGKLAKEYLNEQRAKASPELQQAIDRLWQRILAEGR